ncbi:MAG: glycosyltransferase family 2 protein [Endomicrobiales bacterium]|nr:glycosyltransferase family 2 protein [Endomicrobiales bacterium]
MAEVSVVIPCLNEEQTIRKCIEKAKQSFARDNLDGEVVIVDNGSTDGSVEIAKKAGARVIREDRKGYGSALKRGIQESGGEYIVMGDGDDTYDFSVAGEFVKKLKEGYDLVMGSRFKGNILSGAMTWSHRYIGNPILSGMLRLFFGGGVSDAHCGMRAFTKSAYQNMNLHTTGMEFASEMVIHSLKKKLRIAEIPITYYARLGESKLSSFRDAWRHIRFMLIYSPGYMFLLPGLALFLPSFLATIQFVYGHIFIFGRPWGIHVMVFTSILAILGWQILNIGVAAKIFAFTISLEEDKLVSFLFKVIKLEYALIFGFALFVSGLIIMGRIVYVWYANDFGELEQVNAGLLGLTMIVMGLQTVFTAFLAGMFSIKYRS